MRESRNCKGLKSEVKVLFHTFSFKKKYDLSLAQKILEGLSLTVLADFARIEWTVAAASPMAEGDFWVSLAVLGVLLGGFLIDAVRFAVGRAER